MSEPTITFEPLDGAAPKRISLSPSESVLDGLLRAGVPVANSCRSGVCQSCMLKCTGGVAPADAQKPLKESLRAQGMFLACIAKPANDLTVRPVAGVTQRVPATVRGIEMLSRDVARILLSCDEPLEYFPGQFVNVRRADGLMRSYSLANLRSESPELHVRKVANGRMSTWLHDEARAGDMLELSGPLGDCFYVPGRPTQPILLIGTGTGLAPLYAIARDALAQGHTGDIRLYHGALEQPGLYHQAELRRLAADHANFSYTPCVLRGEPQDGLRVGPIDQVVFADLPKLSGWRVFLCGDPTLVNALRKRVFLAGASMKDIQADAFVMRPATA
jgi:CDP-4-dehydro-6-deoxyglucose reductase, E3